MAFPHWITCEKCGESYSDYASAFGGTVECVSCRIREFPYPEQLVGSHLASEPEFAPVLELYKKISTETQGVRRERGVARELKRLEEERARRIEAVNKHMDAQIKRVTR